MLREHTVFVLGAAVSNELGLPLGGELKTHISGVLPARADRVPDNTLLMALQRAMPRDWFPQAQQVRHGLKNAASIDNLIEHRGHDPNFVLIAKLGIAASISKAERKHATSFEKAVTYQRLFDLMVSTCGRAREEEALQRVTFVTFNYDRTLEAFLRGALRSYSGMSSRDAAEAVSRVNIQHVYGSLGELVSDDPAEWLREPDVLQLEAMAADLRTFSEETGSVEGAELKATVRDAKHLIFLGGALHRRNMDLLKPESTNFQSIYGTQYVPAPSDAHSQPSISEFAAPTILQFKHILARWQKGNQNRIETTNMMIEPLTSYQMAVKYGLAWQE